MGTLRCLSSSPPSILSATVVTGYSANSVSPRMMLRMASELLSMMTLLQSTPNVSMVLAYGVEVGVGVGSGAASLGAAVPCPTRTMPVTRA